MIKWMSTHSLVEMHDVVVHNMRYTSTSCSCVPRSRQNEISLEGGNLSEVILRVSSELCTKGGEEEYGEKS